MDFYPLVFVESCHIDIMCGLRSWRWDLGLHRGLRSSFAFQMKGNILMLQCHDWHLLVNESSSYWYQRSVEWRFSICLQYGGCQNTMYLCFECWQSPMLFCCGFVKLEEQVTRLFVLRLLKFSTHVVVLLSCLGPEVYELKMKAQQMSQASLALRS